MTMAYYRNISLSFWTDAKVEDTFTPEDKYMYLYLLTNPYTNICGCYEISIKQISRQTGYNEEAVARILQRMEQVHKVIVYSKDTQEVLIMNWGRYNWTKSEKLVKPIMSAIGKIKHGQFRDYVTLVYENIEIIDAVSIPYQYGIDTTVSVTDTVTVSVTDKGTKEQKHKYGEYRNVLLSDAEHEKLAAEYKDLPKRIESLSEYMASTGKVYKSHFATIRAWARKDKEKQPQLPGRKRVAFQDYDQGEPVVYTGLDLLAEAREA